MIDAAPAYPTRLLPPRRPWNSDSPSPGIFARTFRRLHGRGLVPDVLYPAVVVPSDAQLAAARAGWKRTLPPDLARFIESRDAVFLSINRFERKKV